MASKEDSTILKPQVSAAAELWQSECSSVRERLSAMRTRGLWTDCELAAGAKAECVPAHRMLLASASPVLASMLHGPLAQSADQPLPLPDIEPDILRLLVKYIYSDDTNINSCEVACDLYRAAHYLMMPHLETVCSTYLVCKVSCCCVLHVYEFAQAFALDKLLKKCLTVITNDASAVLTGIGMGAQIVRADTLAQIFALPELRVRSELELIKAAERWALYHRQQAVTDTEENNARTLLRPALQQIRFLAMDPDEFSEYDLSSLLTQSEILAISLNMLSTKSHMPMPHLFSTSKEWRQKDTLKFKLSASYDTQNSNTEFRKCVSWRLKSTDNGNVYLQCKCVFANLRRFNNRKVRVKLLSFKQGCPDHIFTEKIVPMSQCPVGSEYLDHLLEQFPWGKAMDEDGDYVRDGSLTIEIQIN